MDNTEESKSVWSKAIPFKEQVQIFKRVLKYVKPFKVEMGIAIFGAFLVSVINMLLPRGLQFFLDNYLIKQSNGTDYSLGWTIIWTWNNY